MAHAQVDAPRRPKRAMNAFEWFCEDVRSGKVKLEAGSSDEMDQWMKMDKAIIAEYKKMADKDKARFKKAMAVYEMIRGGNGDADFDPDDGVEEFCDDDADADDEDFNGDVNEVDNDDE